MEKGKGVEVEKNKIMREGHVRGDEYKRKVRNERRKDVGRKKGEGGEAL